LCNKNKIFGHLSVIGSVIFIGVILFLYFIQPQQNFINQYMSELATGKYGNLMVVAFSGFAISVFSVSEILRMLGSPAILRGLFVIASIFFFGAGVINLELNAALHIVFIMIASVLILLGMILSPHFIVEFRHITYRAVSWGLGIIAVLISILNQYCIPAGIGQKITAGCILIWLIYIGIRELLRDNKANSAAAKSRAAY